MCQTCDQKVAAKFVFDTVKKGIPPPYVYDHAAVSEGDKIKIQKWVDTLHAAGFASAVAFGKVGSYLAAGSYFGNASINPVPAAPPPPPPYTPRTQKVRGVKVLQDYGFAVPTFTIVGSDDSKGFATRYPAFARPCPVTPRHGFVDSRVVQSESEARAVWAEARAADPDAEMLLMRPITARASGVITKSSAVIGPSNDGATAGKDCVTIPLVNMVTMIPTDQSGATSAEFLECVQADNGLIYFVQLRNGELANTAQADSIPRDMTVANVLTVTKETYPDALAYESLVKTLPLDTVIYHPGGSLTSHYAVHAVIRGLAVFTTREPKIGESLTANVGAQDPYDGAAFAGGALAGMSQELTDDHANIGGMLLATHHATVMRGRIGSWALGWACAMMVRYGFTAALGEARHARYRAPSRSRIYSAMKADPIGALKRATRVYRLFVEHPWPGGFGGRKWADCMKAVIDLDWSTRRACKDQTAESIVNVIGVLHNAVNQAHNNGWWMNKFTDSDQFDGHASAAARYVVQGAFAIYAAFVKRSINESIARAWLTKRKARLARTFKIVACTSNDGLIVQIGKVGAFDAYTIPYPANWGDTNYLGSYYHKSLASSLAYKNTATESLDGDTSEKWYEISLKKLPDQFQKALLKLIAANPNPKSKALRARRDR